MFNYSVIIPHKNSPGLLQRCIDSIPEREDLQIIVVDDNSNPEIVNFDNFPGADRNNIIFIFNKDGKGAGKARNLALEKASGKWLIFADADDHFAPSFDYILEKFRDDEFTDLVFLNYCKVRDDGAREQMPISRYIRNYKNKRAFSESVLKYSAWSPWSRMLKREIQVENKLLFEELPFSNDMMFVLNATSLAHNIKTETELAYCYYCPSSGTQTSAKFHDPTLRQLRIEGSLKLWRFYKKVGYHFIFPIWLTERGLGIKANSAQKARYGFKAIYNIKDTIYYLFAKVFKVL